MSCSRVNFSAVSGFFRLFFLCGLTFSVNSVCRGFCAVRVLFTTMIHPFTVFVYVVYVSCRGKGVFYWLTLLLCFFSCFFHLQVCIFTCREIEVFIFELEITSLRNYNTGQGQAYAVLGLENIIYDNNNNNKIEVGDKYIQLIMEMT